MRSAFVQVNYAKAADIATLLKADLCFGFYALGSRSMGRGNESDEKLMLCYKNGDADAFEVLYRRHKRPLFRYLLRGLTHQHDGLVPYK